MVPNLDGGVVRRFVPARPICTNRYPLQNRYMESGAFDHQRASPTELYEPRQTRPNRLSKDRPMVPDLDGRVVGRGDERDLPRATD